MSELNKKLAETLRKLADVLESQIQQVGSDASTTINEESIQQFEIRLDDMVNLVQQLSLKIDSIITSLSGLQSQILTLRSTIKRTKPDASSKIVSKPVGEGKEETKKEIEKPEPDAKPESSQTDEGQDAKTEVEEEQDEQSSAEKKEESEQTETESKESDLTGEENESIKDQLVDIERRITDLTFQHDSGFVDDSEYEEQLKDLEKQRDDLLNKVS
ncbi:MAG: hypothetical protein ACTSYO_09105 [Candidatus Ranarchaeia archaeon]